MGTERYSHKNTVNRTKTTFNNSTGQDKKVQEQSAAGLLSLGKSLWEKRIQFSDYNSVICLLACKESANDCAYGTN